MSRETKIGLMVAFSFLLLVGGVLVYKLVFAPEEPTAAALADANDAVSGSKGDPSHAGIAASPAPAEAAVQDTPAQERSPSQMVEQASVSDTPAPGLAAPNLIPTAVPPLKKVPGVETASLTGQQKRPSGHENDGMIAAASCSEPAAPGTPAPGGNIASPYRGSSTTMQESMAKPEPSHELTSPFAPAQPPVIDAPPPIEPSAVPTIESPASVPPPSSRVAPGQFGPAAGSKSSDPGLVMPMEMQPVVEVRPESPGSLNDNRNPEAAHPEPKETAPVAAVPFAQEAPPAPVPPLPSVPSEPFPVDSFRPGTPFKSEPVPPAAPSIETPITPVSPSAPALAPAVPVESAGNPVPSRPVVKPEPAAPITPVKPLVEPTPPVPSFPEVPAPRSVVEPTPPPPPAVPVEPFREPSPPAAPAFPFRTEVESTSPARPAVPSEPIREPSPTAAPEIPFKIEEPATPVRPSTTPKPVESTPAAPPAALDKSGDPSSAPVAATPSAGTRTEAPVEPKPAMTAPVVSAPANRTVATPVAETPKVDRSVESAPKPSTPVVASQNPAAPVLEPASPAVPRTRQPESTSPAARAPEGIPVTIRSPAPAPIVPVVGNPVMPADAGKGSLASRPAAAPGIQVNSFDVEAYQVQAGDTYATISQAKYRTDRYQYVLAMYNRRFDPALTTPVVGKRIYLPPVEYLEQLLRESQGNTAPASRTPAGTWGAGNTSTTVPTIPAPLAPVAAAPAAAARENTRDSAAGIGAPISRYAPIAPASSSRDSARANWTQPGAQKQYQVRPNDHLYTIAKQTLGSGERWPEIFRMNRDRLGDPNQLQAGMILRLPADAKVDDQGTLQ
jgi:hypothetical protein